MPATFFITAPTFHHKRLFQNERFGEALTEILMRCRKQYDLLLHDYVIMPDHVHLLVTIRGNTDVASMMRGLQNALTDRLAAEFGYNGNIWETDFEQRTMHSAQEYDEAVQHIHSNPVRLGFCEKPAEYRLSARSSRWILDPLPEPLSEELQTA